MILVYIAGQLANMNLCCSRSWASLLSSWRSATRGEKLIIVVSVCYGSHGIFKVITLV